jgi:hypothetical protein
MSPQERQKALAQLPPDRRQRMEQQLQRYENLTPQQKQKVQQRLEMLQSLPPRRQAAIRQELQNLRQMPFAQRKQVLNSEQERQKFSPEEMDILRDTFPGAAR